MFGVQGLEVDADTLANVENLLLGEGVVVAAACHGREAALHHAMPWRRYIQARSDLAAHLTEQAPRMS